MGILNCLKLMDIFGYEVKLKIDKENSKHKTCMGSCISVLYFGISAYIFYLCAKDSSIALTDKIFTDLRVSVLGARRLLSQKTKTYSTPFLIDNIN